MPAASELSSTGYAPRALAVMAGFAEREAAVDGRRRFTYGGLHRRVLGMADGLWRHGVRPGQTVGVLAVNPAESLFLQFAVHAQPVLRGSYTTDRPTSRSCTGGLSTMDGLARHGCGTCCTRVPGRPARRWPRT